MAQIAMRTVRTGPVAAAAAAVALAIGIAGERAAIEGDVFADWFWVMDGAVGVVFVITGVVAWVARPDALAGPLVLAMGATWNLGAFGYGTNDALVDYVGYPMQGWSDVLIVVLLLAVSPGGLRERRAQAIAAGVVGTHAVLVLARLLLRPPNDISSCFCVPNRITGITDPSVYDAVARIAAIAEAAFAVGALLVVASRWRAASGPARRTLGVVLVAAAGAAAVVTYNRVVTRATGDPEPTGQGMLIVLDFVRAAIPVAVVVSLARGRRARARVADVVRDLDSRGAGGGPDALRRALADPDVQLLRWSPERRAYLDDEGRPAPLPEPGDTRAATVLEREGTTLGAIVHDSALREEPELLSAVAAAARMALDNERLADEVRARLQEVRASRQRIVEAGEAERRRLERDLHDGAQQRLVSMALGLRMLHQRAANSGDVTLADGLDALAGDLDDALAELRELARGIRPPVLAERGLAPALEALAERAPMPVTLDVRLSGRLPDAVESTAYFVASEALANVLKYADASRAGLAAEDEGGTLVLTVTDDGRGGADPAHGTGLTGLADRLEALGGSLEIQSPAGGGTLLRATVPASRDAALRPSPSPAGT